MRLSDRIAHLERAVNHAPMLLLEIDRRPTATQQCEIDAAIRAGRRLMVFIKAGDTLWLAGAGPAPWSAA